MRSNNTLDRIIERERNSFRPFRYTIALDLHSFDDNMPEFGEFARFTDEVNVNNVTAVVDQMLDLPEQPELVTPKLWHELREGYYWWAGIAPQTLLRLSDVYPGETTMEDIVNTAQKTFLDVTKAREPELWADVTGRAEASAQRMLELYGLKEA